MTPAAAPMVPSARTARDILRELAQALARQAAAEDDARAAAAHAAPELSPAE